jgi:hypothetical protein
MEVGLDQMLMVMVVLSIAHRHSSRIHERRKGHIWHIHKKISFTHRTSTIFGRHEWQTARSDWIAMRKEATVDVHILPDLE